MQNITLQIPEDELRELTHAYQVLQKFLSKLISPNELYTAEFLDGLKQAQNEIVEKDFIEVKDFGEFVQ